MQEETNKVHQNGLTPMAPSLQSHRIASRHLFGKHATDQRGNPLFIF